MKTSEWTTLAISCFALLVSCASAYYAYKADKRSEEATYPIVDWEFERIERRLFKIKAAIKNNDNSDIAVKSLLIDEPKMLNISITSVEGQKLINSGVGSSAEGQFVNFDAVVHAAEKKNIVFRIEIADQAAAPDQMIVRATLTISGGNFSKSPLRFAVSRAL